MNMYLGQQICIAKPVVSPRFRISSDVMLSISFRNEIDKFCDELFGVDIIEVITDGQVIHHNGKLFMNERTYQTIKLSPTIEDI